MSANLHFMPTWDVASQGDRRNGARQRKPIDPAIANVYFLHDRRLGLGRRWEDWCRPATARTKPGVAAVTGEPAPWIR